MFDELVKQVQRLFSSKKNGGKQVAKLTDQLHYQKLVVVALAIVLLLGYAKLRDDFICQGVPGVDAKVTTRFCLINGTTTTVLADTANPGRSLAALNLTSTGTGRAGPRRQTALAPISAATSQAHIGLGFVGAKTRVINHNYMRSQWALLILLAICSYFAQRNWASLFRSDVLKALLKLEGSHELRLVRAAESAKPYEMLSNLKSNLEEELEQRVHRAPESALLPRNEKVSRTIDLVDSHVNIYDHKLDYYPNQLTYLLLTKNTASYKLSCMKLRRALILNALMSTLYTLAQFLLPLVFISSEYLLFGWRYLEAILVYLHKFLTSNEALDINSIDYELSSRIFPISTQCEYKQYGLAGSMEKFTVQCTVAINEIGSKLFMVIWWYVVVSLCVEIYSLTTTLLCSLSRRTVALTFGWRYWPQARKEADQVASFRYVRARLISAHEIAARLRANPAGKCDQQDELGHDGRATCRAEERMNHAHAHHHHHHHERPASSMANGDHQHRQHPKARRKPVVETRYMDAEEAEECERHERKRLEATEEDGARYVAPKMWYNYCPRDLCLGALGLGRRLVCCKAAQRRRRIEQEAERDMNIYYLFYLLYLRVGKSQSRVEEIIKMTARALDNYLVDLENSQRAREPTSPEVKMSPLAQVSLVPGPKLTQAQIDDEMAPAPASVPRSSDQLPTDQGALGGQTEVCEPKSSLCNLV